MSAITGELSPDKSGASRAVLFGGASAGVLDISAAFINSGLQGRRPMFVLQSIASGLLGSASYKGGLTAAALGAALHFSIAFAACIVFYGASRKFGLLTKHPFVCGPLYGAVVYVFMYGIVMPLTFHRGFFRPLSAVVTAVIIHMLCVGLPISLAVRRYGE